jgi:uncharacterized membrane protein YgdD (TMEM256/DUF423 family)
MSYRYLLPITGLLGVLGVALGAFGAHALHESLLARGMLEAWKTAVSYHLTHTAALLAVSLWLQGRPQKSPRLTGAAWAWILGVVLFSGSLYGLALGGPRLLGPVTPLGGLAFIGGWVLVLVEGLKTPARSGA